MTQQQRTAYVQYLASSCKCSVQFSLFFAAKTYLHYFILIRKYSNEFPIITNKLCVNIPDKKIQFVWNSRSLSRAPRSPWTTLWKSITQYKKHQWVTLLSTWGYSCMCNISMKRIWFFEMLPSYWEFCNTAWYCLASQSESIICGSLQAMWFTL